MGCDRGTQKQRQAATLFQSAHPCGVRYPEYTLLPHLVHISIRAPVWGAINCNQCLTDSVSHFNPRTRVGCDDPSGDNKIELWFISIRAPVWGAMSLHTVLLSTLIYFNPRTRVGCDVIGVRYACIKKNFNPRTRVGCDSSFYMGLTHFYEPNS